MLLYNLHMRSKKQGFQALRRNVISENNSIVVIPNAIVIIMCKHNNKMYANKTASVKFSFLVSTFVYIFT